MNKSIEDRIAYLQKCAKDYYNNGKSELTDAEYDAEYDALQELVPDNPFFQEVGAEGETHIYGTKVKHQVIMGSLHKSKNVSDFLTWLKSVYSGEIEVVLQHKVDGLSLGCIYQDGKLVSAVTRGDGITGVDVTPNAKFVYGVKETIAYTGEVEVRGEVYKDKKDFYKNWAGEYANPRNFTAGSLNQKDPQITKDRQLSFIAYEVVRKDFSHETWKLKWLVDNGFETLSTVTKKVTGDLDKVAKAVKYYMDSIDRANLPYDIDGIVVKLNDIKKAKALGTTSEGKRPKANRAVKFPCEQKVATLRDIEWNIGRTGQLTPVGLLEPVELAGTTVKRVSLHNIKNIRTLQLRPGAQVLLQKSGDIIPYVVRKIADGQGKFSMPANCPSCGTVLEWDAEQVTKWCTGTSCPAQMASSIEHWFKKLGVKGVGPAIIETLLQKGSVKSISDMYNLQDMSSVFGDKAFKNIKDAVNSVKEITLAKFIEALGIGQIGTMAKDIVGVAPTIEDVDKLTVADIVKIEGFADTKASSFINGWKGQRQEIDKILQSVKIVQPKRDSNKLNGKMFCITGTLSKGRKEFQDLIESNGGKFSSSVSSKLDYLICGEDCGSKKEKAEKAGVAIISENDFIKLLN